MFSYRNMGGYEDSLSHQPVPLLDKDYFPPLAATICVPWTASMSKAYACASPCPAIRIIEITWSLNYRFTGFER